MANAEETSKSLREIFMDSDSDSEFEGFTEEEIAAHVTVEWNEEDDGSEDDVGPLGEVEEVAEPASWKKGGRKPTVPVHNPRNPHTTIDKDNILDYFKLFVDDATLDSICEETNRYAAQFLRQARLKPHSRFHEWTDLTTDDVKSFLALILAMGLVHQLDLHDYWTTVDVNSTPFFATVMPRNKFLLILSLFHINDNTTAKPRTDPTYDKLHKIRPFYDSLISKFQSTYAPTENLALDEATIGWRGNLSFRVYNPDKPQKFGIKIYEVCDSKNGFCTNLEIYSGKQTVISEKGATHDVVMRLVAPYLDQGFKVFMDNYYTSPTLFQDLYDHDTGACGTLRVNRKGVPSAIKAKTKLKKGDSIVMNNGDLLAIKWKDKRDVNMLTTIHDGDFAATGKKDRVSGEDIIKPTAIIEYNKHMGGVDRSDQMLQYQAFQRKTLKWWKKAFFHLFDLACLNAYILYKESAQSNNEPVDLHRVFRRKLVQQLLLDRTVTPTPSTSSRRHVPNEENVVRLTASHNPSFVPWTKKKLTPTRVCVVCSSSSTSNKRDAAGEKKAKRKESRYQCTPCNVGLCAAPCFALYHEYLDYKAAHARWLAEQERLLAERNAAQDASDSD